MHGFDSQAWLTEKERLLGMPIHEFALTRSRNRQIDRQAFAHLQGTLVVTSHDDAGSPQLLGSVADNLHPRRCTRQPARWKDRQTDLHPPPMDPTSQ
jgi:hypothetical protein